MKSDFYVYCYFRPTGEPCYIGKGSRGRWKDHLKKSQNLYLRRIITKAGGEVPHVKLHVGLTEDQATAYEVALIKAIGRTPNGPLVNLTDGGDGLSGHKFSEQHRKKIGAAHVGNTNCLGKTWKVKTKRTPWNKGKTYRNKAAKSPETIARMRAARLGKKASAETRVKMSVTRLGKPRGPFSAEHRARLSEAARKRKKAA